MTNEHRLQAGDEVRALSTGRRMKVRSVEGERVRCTWFDGREHREVSIPLESVRPTSATHDDRLFNFT